MKKLFSILLMGSAMLAFTACELHDNNSIFDESASQRSLDNIESVHKILQTATNGWQMEYYGSLGYGGYNVMVKFGDSEATFASEKLGPSHMAGIGEDGKCVTCTSHYKLEQSQGTVVSFDEYNELFHYFSMPNNPDGYGDTSDGFYGDFEFRVIKATNDSIILRGKKHQNRIVMTPIPAGKTWESIIEEVDETEYYMSSRSYSLTGVDRTNRQDSIDIEVVSSYRCLYFSYKDSLGLTQTVTAPYIVKNDGYYFYSPVEVNGYELDGLEKGTTDDYFLFRNNPNLQLDSYVPPLSDYLTTGLWYLRYETMGDYAQPKWNAMIDILNTAGRDKAKISLRYVAVGLYQNKFGCHMWAGGDTPYQIFNTSNINEDGTRITLKRSTSTSGSNRDGKTYYNDYGWKDALEALCGSGSSGRTFDISCDYQRRPTYLILTDVNNPSNVIVLYSSQYYFMDTSYYND